MSAGRGTIRVRTARSRTARSRTARSSTAAALGAAVLLLSGCGGGAAGVTGIAGADAAEGDSAVVLFAPASLTDLAPQLTEAYARETGDDTEIVVNLGSSAQLVQQANAGQAPDVLITADVPALEALERPVDFSRREDLALNRMVLAVPADSRITAPDQLAGAAAVAACAPSVPCGRAANAYLEGSGTVLSHVSEEDDVRAVLAKVASGQVDAGFVYATDAAAAGSAVRSIPLPGTAPNSYPLLVAADASGSAEAFAGWLLGDTAAALLARAGFAAP
jgi:molybdate transport system substrate-binding protein